LKKLLEWGGLIAGGILVVFGAAAIYMGVTGYTEVQDTLAQENITGTADAAEITDGDLTEGQLVDTGGEARAFADIMRHHTLEATEGQTYAEMGRFLDENGQATNDESAAATDPESGQPVENGLRNMWVTQTALATALNMAYMSEQLALFGIVVGVALVLAGIGFIILSLSGAVRHGPSFRSAPGAAQVG
jgi:hypothetical protein